jgi:hypothetical protein
LVAPAMVASGARTPLDVAGGVPGIEYIDAARYLRPGRTTASPSLVDLAARAISSRWLCGSARLAGAEMATMAGSKKKTKSKKQTRAKSAPKGAAAKKSLKKSAKPTKKASSAKKVAAKKKAAARKPHRPGSPQFPPQRPKAFAEKVQDYDAGTGIWFMVAGGIEHAVIQRRGSDGAVVIRTDAGVTEVVSLGNLFETANEARAARYR